MIEDGSPDQKKGTKHMTVEISLLSMDTILYSHPALLLFKGGKRAEAGQWSLEVQKMLRGITESTIVLENIMNQISFDQKVSVDGLEIQMSDEKRSWLMTYVVDNGIIRIFACLDKFAQMCRCFFEHPANGGPLKMRCNCKGCKCEEEMDEKNCNFGKLHTVLNSKTEELVKHNPDSQKIIDAINKLNNESGIATLRPYRNAFAHKKHIGDQSGGIDPVVKATYSDGMVETSFKFGITSPNPDWYWRELVKANNAIAACFEEISPIIFPRDFEIKKTEQSKSK